MTPEIEFVSTDNSQKAQFEYVNWKGKPATRTIEARRVYYGQTSYYPTNRWLLVAWDSEKADWRTFDLAKVKNWRVAE